MIRLIVLSWISIIFGSALIISTGAGLTNSSMLLYALGNTLLILPNVIWILASNKLASAALNKPPSLLVTASSIIAALAVFLSFGLLSSVVFLPDGTSTSSFLSNAALESMAMVSFLTIFVALITSIILVSRRIIDTQDSPEAGRGSRVFVLCICFFYIAIGMFFIAPKLKKLKTKTV